ncbi:MAG: phosphoribosyltransferase [Clostridiales bacterium]|jgi:ComF family protein|nr:phosphoribosyltransferase [Clostridiales bacterium]
MLEILMNILFPPKCIVCKKLLSPMIELSICEDCYREITFLGSDRISAFDLDVDTNYCDEVLCVCEYSEAVKEMITKFKFSNKPSYYRVLGKFLAKKIKEMTNYDKFDIIISVPLSKEKFNKRGYNQSQLIASKVSKEICIPEKSKLLSRVRDTGSQSLLAKRDRCLNVRNAFRVTDMNAVSGKSIILIDDVLTTGNTVNECSRVLKEAGAMEVMVAVIASGRTHIT